MKSVLLAGASGLVGGELLARLLADPEVMVLHTLGRRELAVQHPKLTHHVVDFSSIRALPSAEGVSVPRGTPIRGAGSEEAFRGVDYEAKGGVARAARRTGAQRLGLVSAMGASARSSIFYNRVK